MFQFVLFVVLMVRIFELVPIFEPLTLYPVRQDHNRCKPCYGVKLRKNFVLTNCLLNLTRLRILAFSRPRNGRIFPPSETLIKLLVIYVGMAAEFFTGLGDAHNGAHMTMVFFFSFHCCFEILYHYGAHFIIPKGLDYLCVALAFSVEAFCFSWHLEVIYYNSTQYSLIVNLFQAKNFYMVSHSHFTLSL